MTHRNSSSETKMIHEGHCRTDKMSWMEWVDCVEAIMGGDLDDVGAARDERSLLDKAYDAYEAGMSPDAYVGQAIIESNPSAAD